MSVRSMTGFGRARAAVEDVSIEVEVRSVNHRFLDISCKLPSAYLEFERDVAGVIRDKLSRGRVDLAAVRTEAAAKASEVVFNEQLFSAYWAAVERGLTFAGVTTRLSRALGVVNALSRRDVLEVSQPAVNAENEREALLSAVAEALDSLIRMREAEGDSLRKELLSHLAQLEGHVGALSNLAENSSALFKERLTQRLEKLQPDVEFDPERLAQEVAYLAERTDVTEELARLQSHTAQFRKLLKQEQTGRKVEFLIQEMGREVNTCGSKSQSSDISAIVVEMKAALEKMREQIQNVE